MDPTWLDEWKDEDQTMGPVVTHDEYEERFGVPRTKTTSNGPNLTVFF